MRDAGQGLIVTNGDQTGHRLGRTASGRKLAKPPCVPVSFEAGRPQLDAPHLRLCSAGDGSYKLSILKAADPEGTACCQRFFYEYPAAPGLGHFLHTYVCDGNPAIPTFQGEPERVEHRRRTSTISPGELWESLNADNKVSLFVRYIDLETREYQQRIVNKHVK